MASAGSSAALRRLHGPALTCAAAVHASVHRSGAVQTPVEAGQLCSLLLGLRPGWGVQEKEWVQLEIESANRGGLVAFFEGTVVFIPFSRIPKEAGTIVTPEVGLLSAAPALLRLVHARRVPSPHDPALPLRCRL